MKAKRPTKNQTGPPNLRGVGYGVLAVITILALIWLIGSDRSTTGLETAKDEARGNTGNTRTGETTRRYPLINPSNTQAVSQLNQVNSNQGPSYLTSSIHRLDIPNTNETRSTLERSRLPSDMFEIQLALDRLGFSPGSLDGVGGIRTKRAIQAFQAAYRLPQTGIIDGQTRSSLFLVDPLVRLHAITSSDIGRLRRTGKSWTEKARQDRMDYESVLEMVAELGHAHPDYIRIMNPGVEWERIKPETIVRIPFVMSNEVKEKGASIQIRLGQNQLQLLSESGRILLHMPCSIARLVEKRPVGSLRVISKASNPNYKFNPSMFPDSAEAKSGGKPMMLAPGPNNPVGSGWIGLSRSGYGIHGTPHPEAIGRTESHGCFRLANWNVERLLPYIWLGMPVEVFP